MDLKQLGKEIKKWQIDNDVSNQELADLMKVSIETARKMTVGEAVRKYNYQRLAAVMNRSITVTLTFSPKEV